ncbi:hypothetical protein Tco_0465661 [Tanacetum coccineum]
MLEEFTSWFRTLICERHANNLQDPEVSTTSELFALANGPSRTPMSVNACVVDGVRYVVQSRDERRTTQNSGICAPGPDGEMSYGQLQEILEFKYLSFKVALFRMADVARAHGGDGGGEDPSRPPPTSFGLRGLLHQPRAAERRQEKDPGKGPGPSIKGNAVTANKSTSITLGAAYEIRAHGIESKETIRLSFGNHYNTKLGNLEKGSVDQRPRLELMIWIRDQAGQTDEYHE